MNSRQLVFKTLNGEEVPRWPCGPLAVHFCARDMGISIRQYSLDAQLLADSVLSYYDKYRPDAVWISSDTWVTAEAMGAPVRSPGEDEPMAGDNDGVIHTPSDLDAIPDPDPFSQGRQPLMLDAVLRVKQALGDDVFIVACFDQAPFSLACAVGGISDIMIKTLSDPEFVCALVERCADYATAYAQALASVGADMLSTGDSPAGLVGPDLFQQFCLPSEQRVFQELKNSTDCKLSLHICGDATEILPHMVQSGAHVLELDHLVDIEQACAVVPEEIAIWGNLDPVGVLMTGNEQRVAAEAKDVLEKVAAADRRRFVLSSGCTLAPATPAENLKALMSAARATPPIISKIASTTDHASTDSSVPAASVSDDIPPQQSPK